MPTTQHHVCLYWDIENSTGLRSQFTTPIWESMRSQVVTLFKSCLPERNVVTGGDPIFGGKLRPARIISDNGDGDLAIFVSSKDAVETALKFQWKVSRHDWKGAPIRVCIGIDGGDTDLRESDDHGVLIPTGKVLDNGSRVASIARPGQILVTARVSADARDHMSHLPNEIRHREDGTELKLHFAKHGFFDYQGRQESDDLLFICEVGILGVTPFESPPNSAKCWPCDDKGTRIVTEKPEWQPIQGALVPGNTGGSWELVRKLGTGGFGEAWLAIDQHTRAERVFKFPNDPQRARSFFRETTLATFVQKQLARLGDAHHANAIAKVLGLATDAPYWIATEHYPEGSLSDWCAAHHKGILSLTQNQRIQFVIELCRAVHAAHQVEVIHRDIKPGNIFIRHDPRSGTIHPILADFGIGCILRPELLDEEGYTRAGFTHPNTLGPGSRTGTSMYAPPEYEKMRAKASPKGDVYSIGVLLYQMLIGDFTQPWESAQECERRIPDSPALHAPDCHLNPFIRKAILKALDAEDHRFASADELALKLTELQRDYEEDEATKAQQKNQRLRKLLSLSAAAVIVLTGLAFWAMRSENRAVDAESQQRASASALKIQRDANEKLVDDRGLALRQKTQGTGFNAPPSDMKLLLPHVLEASRAVQVTDLQQRRIQAQRLMRLCEWLGDSIEAVSQYDSALLQLATFHRDSPEDDVMRVAYLDALFFSRRWAHTWIEKAVSSKVGDAWVADNAELVKMCRLRITTWSDDAIKVTTEASSSKPDSYVVLHEAFAYLSKVLLLKAAERVPAIRSSATSPSGDIPIPTLPNLGENLKAFAEKWLLAQSHTTSMPWESLPQAQIDIPGHTTPVTMSWQFISKNTLSLTMLHWSVIGLDDAYTRDVASAELGLAVIKTCRQRASVAVTEGDGTYAEELFGKIQAYLAVAAPMTDQNRLHHEMAQFYHQLGHYQESRRSEAAIESYSHNLDAWKWLNTKHPEESKYKLEMVATLRHRVNALLTIGLDSPEWDEKARTWCNEALILFDTLPPDVQKSSQGELRSVLGLRATFGKDAQDKLSYLNRSVGVARVALDNTGRLGANNQEALMDLAFSLQQAAAQLIQDGGDLKNAQLQAQEAIKLLTEEVMIPQPSQKANLLMVRLHNVIGRVAAERHDSELRGEEFSAAYAAAAKLDLSELSNRFVYFEASLSLGSHLMEVQRYGEAMKALSPAINQALALSKTSPGLHPAELSIVSRLCGLMIKAHYWTAEPGVHETVLGAAGATQRILHQPWLMGSLNKDQKEILHTALSIIAVRGLSLIDSSASQKDGGVPIPEIVNNHFAESKLALKELGNPPTFSSWETYLSYRIADFIDSRWDDKSKEECQAAFNEFLSQVRERASMQPLAIRSAIIALCDLSTAHARMEHWSDAHSMYQAAERMLDDPIYKMAKDKHCLLALAQIAGAMHELTNRKGLTEPSLFWHSELLRLKERMAIELTETHTAQGDAFSDFIQNLTTTREINRVFRALVESQKRGIPAVLYDRETPRGAKMAGPDADGRTMTQELFLQRGSLTSALLPDDPAPTRESEIRNIKKAESEIHATKKPRTDAPLEKQSRLLISALDNAAFQCLAGGKMSDAEKWARQSLALDTEGFAATAHLVCSLLFQDKDVEAFNLCSDQLLRSTKSSWLAETVLDDLTILRIHGRQHAKERLLVKVIYEHAAPALLRLRLDKLKLAEIAHEKTPSQQTSADLGSALSSLSDCEVYVKRWGDAESHARKAVQMNPYREYAHANLATSLLLQGKYEEALFIYQTHWLEPTSGWTLGDSILLDFERLEAIGITHPELARVKEDMAKLAEKDKQPAKAKDPPFNPIKP